MTHDDLALDKKIRVYQWALLPVARSGSINVECNELTMINKGSQAVVVNGVLQLTTGQSITFPGYPAEICTQAFDITFTNDRQQGCLLILVMKEYKGGYE